MHALVGSMAALVVAAIYFGWRRYFQHRVHRLRLLQERVAYMLWVLADQAEDSPVCAADRQTGGADGRVDSAGSEGKSTSCLTGADL